ncbi:S-phase kinase-associated protein 2 [Neocloeon triangulifer]|uniref:S-phase kinase-associated protein 2 n=1 Tax=Neocloeon triangulifer TaxID=2078957 RepID=UPI00286F5384|nr:S-phase kinase-associated protein 2 [Neocloeon triangulifer]XP_059472876.1 S-phase kinase-associated protein 2 [Neocloeon triangulifer]
MYGGKRARPKSHENSQELDENACPNATKKRRTDKDFDVIGDKRLELDDLTSNFSEDDESTYTDSDDSIPLHRSDHSPKKKRPSSPPSNHNDNNAKMLSTPDNKYVLNDCIQKNCHFNKLSDEMMLSIFLWLPKVQLSRVALVCKRWRCIAYDDTLWGRLDLNNKSLHPRNLEHVLKRGVLVLRLTGAIIPSPVIKPNSSYLPLNFVSKIQYLDLTMAQISDEGLAELLKTCRHLRKLSLENCPLNQAVCEQIGHNVELEVLNLTSATGLKSNGLEAILACCTKLYALNVAWTAMDQETLNTLSVTLSQSIKYLNVAGCRKNLSDDHVKKVIEKCPNLEELDLSDCTNLTSVTLECIIAKLDKLEHLSLSRCYNMANSNFKSLEKMESLDYLELFGVLHDSVLNALTNDMETISINHFPFSSIARPTTGYRRTSLWGLRVRD